MAKDCLTYTLYLRKGVQWQGGWGEFTAEDIKYTYERSMRKDSINFFKKHLNNSIKRMEVVDPYTLRIHLKKPNAEFEEIILQKAAPIISKKYVETVGDEKARWEPIGTGPYRMIEHREGEYIKYEAVDKHWRIVPEFKYLYQYIVPEESTRWAMLQTKKIDLASVNQTRVPEIKKIAVMDFKVSPGGYNIYVVFGGQITPEDKRFEKGYHSSDPWVDVRVREAMSIAINREDICKNFYKGLAKPITLGWMLPGHEDLPPIPYDPERAKKLLAEAGYPNGFEFTAIGSGAWPPAVEMPQIIEILAGYWERIGLRPKLLPMDKVEVRRVGRVGKHVNHVYTWKDVFRDSWSGKHEDRFKPGSSGTHFQSPEITALIDAYEGECDPVKRAANLEKLRDFHYNNWVSIPLILTGDIWVFNKEVMGDWPIEWLDKGKNIEYIRHAKPLNTFRLFEME
jgi:peptide/nickel transport system substrate-binding protein